MSRKAPIEAVNTPTKPSVSPHVVLALGIFAVASSSLLIRFAQAEVGSLVIAAYRMALSALILIPLTLPRHSGELRGLSRRGVALAALSGVLLAVHFASWILSLEYTSVASSVVLVTTNPLWVALLAPLVLKERLGRGVLLGMLVALAGGVGVALSDSCTLAASGLACPPWQEFVAGRAFYGNLLALVGALSGAGYILIGRILRPQLSLTAYIFLVYGMAALVLVALVPFSGQAAFGFSPSSYVYLLLLAVLPQLIGHSSFNWALAHLPASYVSIALLGEPVSSIVLATLLLGETPSGFKLLGAGLILVGILIASLAPGAQAPDV
ncbi:MAG: DMT family transporter [Anaerolineales bacterium]|nr:DMT family transporter [Anaerolineales bacterium]